MSERTPQVTLATVCTPSEDVVAREIEGDLIIVPLVAGIGDADDELFTLNESGKAIWTRLDGRRTLGEVARSIADEFEVTLAEVEADIVGFAREMTERRILVARG